MIHHAAPSPRPDSQSGPRRGTKGFFHFSLTWVRGEEGSISSLSVANYMDRLGPRAGLRHALGVECGRTAELTNYIDRRGRHSSAQRDELGEAVLLTCGLPVTTGQALARALDARERKADRTYRRHGGRLPRVASHMIGSFSYGMTSEQAHAVVQTFASALSKRLGVPLYGRIHNKSGEPDHVHLLIGTRTVTRGKLGAKARALDAVSEKIAGNSIAIGEGKTVSQTCEWMRAEWARLLRKATQDYAIDHRSYARQGRDIVPVTHVPRARIDREERENSTAWRDQRRRELEARNASQTLKSSQSTSEIAQSRRKQKISRPAEAEAVVGQEHSAVRARRQLHAFLNPIMKAAAEEGSPAQVLSNQFGIDIPGEILAAALRRRKASPRADEPRSDRSRSSFRPDPDPIYDVSKKLGASHAGTKASPRDDHRVSSVVHAAEEVNAAVDLYRLLKRSHRLSGDRSLQLSAAVGMNLTSFETLARSRSEGDGSRAARQPTAAMLPTRLWTLWEEWSREDNAARRIRRGQQAARESTPTAVSQVAAVSPADVQEAAVASGLISPSKSVEGVQNDEPPQANIKGPKVRGINDRPDPTPTEAEHQRFAAQHNVMAASGSLAEALYSAIVADIRLHHVRKGKTAPEGAGRLWRVALALRATGRNTEEVIAILRQGVAKMEGTVSDPMLVDCARSAFTEDMGRKLHASSTFVDRIRHLEAATEATVYRQMRSDVLSALRTDLDDVWIKRRMLADEAQRRHAARLALLHDVTWRTRNLRRNGLVPLIISLLVELAVLRPLITRQKAAGAAERAEINARAIQATAGLKALRAQWQSITPEKYRDWLVHRGSSTATLNVKDASSIDLVSAPSPSPPQSPPAQKRPAVLPTDDRRKAVADVALVLIARGRYTGTLGDRLATLGSTSRTDLRQTAYHRSRDLGIKEPAELTTIVIQQLWTNALGIAKAHAWDELISLMHEITRRSNRTRLEKGSSSRSDIT